MSVKFFGQYLIERGEIDAAQLRGALEFVREQNRPLGEIAIQQAFLSKAEARDVNEGQRGRDRPFGELAVELGLLTPDELARALSLQQDTHLLLGEALIRLGHLEAERLGGLLDEYKNDQSLYEVAPKELPGALAGHRLAPIVLDLLPKLCRRVGGVSAKLGRGKRLRARDDLPHRVRIVVGGPVALGVSLLADEAFARRVGAGAVRAAPEELDETLFGDALAEFLNVVLGNAVGVLCREGASAELGPPTFGAEPGAGLGFDLASTEGDAYLVLEPAG